MSSALTMTIRTGSCRNAHFDWLPCLIAQDTACSRDTYFQPVQTNDTGEAVVHLRGRTLKGVRPSLARRQLSQRSSAKRFSENVLPGLRHLERKFHFVQTAARWWLLFGSHHLRRHGLNHVLQCTTRSVELSLDGYAAVRSCSEAMQGFHTSSQTLTGFCMSSANRLLQTKVHCAPIGRPKRLHPLRTCGSMQLHQRL
jgi:hypothetical protein